MTTAANRVDAVESIDVLLMRRAAQLAREEEGIVGLPVRELAVVGAAAAAGVATGVALLVFGARLAVAGTRDLLGR